MALSPRQQACLDRYLASFTPDISEQISDLRSIADDLDAVHKLYQEGLSAIGTARDRLQAAADAAREDPPPPEALATLLTAVDDCGHDLDEIFMDELPTTDGNGFYPLEVARDTIVTLTDQLTDAARALDDRADRLGQTA